MSDIHGGVKDLMNVLNGDGRCMRMTHQKAICEIFEWQNSFEIEWQKILQLKKKSLPSCATPITNFMQCATLYSLILKNISVEKGPCPRLVPVLAMVVTSPMEPAQLLPILADPRYILWLHVLNRATDIQPSQILQSPQLAESALQRHIQSLPIPILPILVIQG